MHPYAQHKAWQIKGYLVKLVELKKKKKRMCFGNGEKFGVICEWAIRCQVEQEWIVGSGLQQARADMKGF